jgi:peptide/nickel transport system substrate-binding protein
MNGIVRSKKLVFSVLILVLVVSLILFGTSCGEKTTTTSPSATTPTSTGVTPKSGGTLKIYSLEPRSLGYPATMTGQTDGQTSSMALETLFRLDEKGNIVPLLATGYTSDPATKTITITLRKNVKFHDGSDFNAAVAKWNLEEFQSGARPDLKNVASVDVIDDYTIKLNLKNFDNTIMIYLATASDAGRMISKQSYDANGGKDWCIKNPIGTGPFKFVSWTPDVAIKWTRNDNYWGGKPYLDGVDHIRIADPTTGLMSFKSGGLDIYNPDPVDAKPMIAEGKWNYVITPEGQVPALAGYAKDPSSPWSKLEVRQAMAYAVDNKALAATFGLDFWQVQNQWAVPGSWGYNPNVVGYPFNPTKAKELLAKAGYSDGFDTTLNFYSTNQAIIDECTAIQKMLKDVGINAELAPLQRPAFADMASNMKGWSGIVRMQGFSSFDPLVKYAGVAAGQEFAGVYLPQEFVDKYNEATQAPEQTMKQKLTWELMALATDKYCIATHLYMQSQALTKNKRIQDDGYGEQPYRYLNPKTWLSE